MNIFFRKYRITYMYYVYLNFSVFENCNTIHFNWDKTKQNYCTSWAFLSESEQQTLPPTAIPTLLGCLRPSLQGLIQDHRVRQHFSKSVNPTPGDTMLPLSRQSRNDLIFCTSLRIFWLTQHFSPSQKLHPTTLGDKSKYKITLHSTKPQALMLYIRRLLKH